MVYDHAVSFVRCMYLSDMSRQKVMRLPAARENKIHTHLMGTRYNIVILYHYKKHRNHRRKRMIKDQ